MTSLQSAYKQIPTNALYVNIGNANSTITDANQSTITFPAGINTLLSNPGQCVLRDMGKTLYLPAPTQTPVSAVGGISTVLRKVQIVPSGALGVYGTGVGSSNYYTGYIQIGGLTYGGGNGSGAGGNGDSFTVKFVRLN
jgi:hypothetical protein